MWSNRAYQFLNLSRAFSAALVLVIVFGQPGLVFAGTGAPRILNYQGRLMDSSGTLLGGTGTEYCFKFSIYDNATVGSGSKLWPASAPSSMTAVVKNGVFSVGVGDTNAGGDLLDFDFQSVDTAYLNVEVAQKVGATCAPGDGAETFENLEPRNRIDSAGYAINANTLGGYAPAQAASGDAIPVLSSDQLLLGGANAGVSATNTAALTIQGNSSGNINFFDTNTFLTSSGDLTLAGLLTADRIVFVSGTSTSIFTNLLAASAAAFGATATSSFDAAGQLTLAGGFDGPLQANAGVVSATSTVGVRYGGTGISSVPTFGELLLGTAAGGYALAATSTLGLPTFASLASYLSLSAWYATTTDALAEGSTNKYFTVDRVSAVLAATTTDALAEGSTNLYFTDTRATNNFIANLAATTSVSSITTLPNLLLPATQLTGFGVPFYQFFNSTTTDALAEGSVNKYYTDARVDAFVGASTTIAKTYANNTFTGANSFTGNTLLGNATSSNLFAAAFSSLDGVFGDLVATTSANLASTTAQGRFIAGNIISTSTATSTFAGPLAIGVATPSSLASIAGSITAGSGSTGTAILTVGNGSNSLSSGTNVLRLNLATGASTCTAGTTCPRFVEFFRGVTAGTDTGGTGIGRINVATGGNGVTYGSGAADLAEYMQLNGAATAGDLVSLNAAGEYQKAVAGESLIGVISTAPAFVGNTGIEGNVNAYVVGFAGVVTTTVSDANGPIAAGDFVGASPTAGVGQKLSGSGFTLGQALESFAGPGTGSIRVLVAPKFVDGVVAFEKYGGSDGGVTGYWNLSTSTGAVTLASSTYSLVVNNRAIIDYASSTAFSSTYASSTAGFFGSLSVGNLSGILKASGGAVSTALVGLASDVSGILGIANGGTGTSTAPSYGQLLIGNAQGGYDYVATSSLGINSGVWGAITGNIVDQTDLQAALDAKLSLSNWYGTTTDGLNEGSTNLYFTTARADTNFANNLAATTTTALAEGTNLYYTDTRATNNFVSNLAATTSVSSITTLPSLTLPALQLTGFGVPFYTFFNSTTTDALAEGSTNLYFTQDRVAGVLAGTTTDALAEGPTNLYYTAARATNSFIANLAGTTTVASLTTLPNLAITASQVSDFAAAAASAADAYIAASTTIPKTYADNIFTGTQTFANASTTNLSAEYASSTIANFGSVSITGLSGVVKASGGTLYSGVVNLASEVTGIVPIANGGTGTSTAPATGALLVGNQAGGFDYLSTSTLGLSSSDITEGTNLFYQDSRVNTYLNSSTTLAKTYTANTFTDTNTFDGQTNLAYASSTGISASYASSTAGFFGSLSVGTLTGLLRATAGAIATGFVNLASEVTGILSVANGGTGWAAIQAGSIPYGNGTGALATTSAGTAGQVLALLNGVPTWTSTTTFGYPLQFAAGNVTLAFGTTTNNAWSGTNSFAGQTTLAQASSTAQSTLDYIAVGRTATTTIRGETNATSTFAGGIDLSHGCLAINGNCIGAGGGGGGSGTLVNIQVFSTAGTTTYTPSAGATVAYVVVTGGGGGGGAANSPSADTTNETIGGGGGAGGTSIGIIDLTATTSVQVVVGAGGAGGTAGTATANAGAGGSYSYIGTYASSTGGTGGVGAAVNATGCATNGAIGAAGTGGTGALGSINLSGGAGLSGSCAAEAVIGGTGGSSYWGEGGAGARDPAANGSSAGISATTFGAGGGGAASEDSSGTGASGGNGGNGAVVVYEYGPFTGIMTIANGGTGLSSAPAYGQVLVGNSSGGYTLMSTSSLNIASGGSSFGYLFPGNATTTKLAFDGGLSTTYASSTGISSGYASSTAGFFGSLSIGSLSGILKATAGAISTALVNLSSDVTGILSVANGGTGWANIQANTLVTGNGTGALATTTVGTSLLLSGGSLGINLSNANTWSALQTFGNASTTNLSATYASSTLGFFGSLSVGSLTGVLKASAGALSASFVDLASEITGILGVANGGTGWNEIAANSLLLGNGTGAVATTSPGTDGEVLALVNGVPTWQATTTLSTIGGVLSETQGGTGKVTYNTGDILYASGIDTLAKLPVGGSGQVLKVVGGLPTWSVDLTGGGGSGGITGAWATTTNDMAIYPADPTDVVVVGTTATSTSFAEFEVAGQSYFSGNVGIATTSFGTLLAIGNTANFTAAMTTLYSGLSVIGDSSFANIAAAGVTAQSAGLGSLAVGTVSTTSIQGDAAGTSTIQGFVQVLGTQSTSTFSGGLSANTFAVTGSATSSFGGGADITSGCFSINGVCLATGVSDVSNADGTLVVSPTNGSVVASLNLAHANTWSALQTITSASSTAFSSSYASSTDLRAGSFTLGTLSGVLRAASGAVTSGLVNLASEVSGVLAVANGGTGWANIQAGTLLTGNGSGQLATTTIGSTLQISGSTLGLNLSSANVWTGLQRFVGNASSTALSALDAVQVGRTATTTIRGEANATSTFAGGVQANAFAAATNATSTFGGIQAAGLNVTTSTSTFGNGINVTGGCIAYNGQCIATKGIDGVTVTTFTAGGTWTKSNYSGLSFTQIIVTGGGGGGGGADGTDTTNETSGAGGGAGGTAIKMIAAGALGTTETVTVGGGGAGGLNTGTNGSTGVASSFGTHASANPGTGGGGTGTTNATGCATNLALGGNLGGGTGGTATGGDINLTGGAGNIGACASGEAVVGGTGGASYWGGGGQGAADPNGNLSNPGGAGAAYGSGGGGAADEDSTTGAAGGTGAGGVVVAMNYTSSGGDLAEWYETEGDVEATDIVAIGGDNYTYDSKLGLQSSSVMKKASVGDTVVGVVSSAPYQTIGLDALGKAQHPRPIALAGRVPVKVSDENGDVHAGDLVTLSSQAGVAMRSTKAGVTIGRAIDDMRCDETDACTVLIMVNTAYSTGVLTKVALRDQGIDMDAIPAGIDVGRVILASKLQQKQDITASTTLSEVNTDRVVAGLEIITPRVVTKTLVVGGIEPLDKDIALHIADGGVFRIEKVGAQDLTMTFGTATTTPGTAILTVDDIGNAIFAGALSAASLEIGNADTPGGITMYDASTKKPYCTRVVDGELKTAAGKCGSPEQLASAAAAAQSEGAPIISIQGNNPAQLSVGDVYNDLGVLVHDDKGDNLAVTALVDGSEVSSIALDTSAAGTHTIVYRVTDNDGHTSEATRSVIVGEPAAVASQDTAMSTPETAPDIEPTEPEQTPDVAAEPAPSQDVQASATTSSPAL